MSKMISVGKSPRIIADSIGGDVSVVGWDGNEILIKADDDELNLQQNGDEIRFSCEDDMSIRVPKDSNLSFIRIHGDAAVRGVSGNIEIKEINGDLSMRDVGSVSIDSIQADFSLRGARGNLYLRNASGDVSIRDVDGNVNIESISDDLALRGARGNIKVNVGEDVVVYLEPREDGNYVVTAGDDILMVLPPHANATVTMQGDEVDVQWPGVPEEPDATSRVVTLGTGSAKIVLTAGGDVRLTNQANAAESAEEFGNFAGLNFDWSGFGERISRQVEQVTQRAAKRAEEAARRAERHAERHARRWGGRVNFGPGPSWSDFGPKGMPTPPGGSKSEPVADEERMAILKMLQEKKITAEQAEQLLRALEGGK
ncbi:MAG: SHOCT-like domain-containing protein [Byssovorax cruenta]